MSCLSVLAFFKESSMPPHLQNLNAGVQEGTYQGHRETGIQTQP